ncbi:Meiotically up-regulated gene 60 protein [Bienertia sinuspersici]
MVGQRLPAVNKPSRSDEVVDPQHQVQITDKVKAQFESMAPKRPIKPNRSEPDAHAASLGHQPNNSQQPIPELQNLLSLNSTHHQVTGEEWVEQEEFVETQYYKQLESIDKQHHTTGTGFIKATKEGGENGEKYKFNGGEMKMEVLSEYKSNPATNDWGSQ